MCGIVGLFGPGWRHEQLDAMVASQHHRGPDASGTFACASGVAALGHNRLSIIDLSSAGAQPMCSRDGRYWIAFNGEVYNFRELRAELGDYPFRSQTDTEVLLAAFERWGAAFLDRLVGMFALLIWDTRERRLFAARDRFGVKPFFYMVRTDGGLAVASEIGAFRAAGMTSGPDPVAWATYLATGVHDHSERTFWAGVRSLPAGHALSWHDGALRARRWYDLADHVGPAFDARAEDDVQEEYLSLLRDSIRLRFRADVPVGINLSGGLDSSVLLGLVHDVRGADSDVAAFTFVTGDARYDELPWVERMLAHTRHPLVACRLAAEDVPALAEQVQRHQDEPFGGLPTLAYARLFEEARARGVRVLLDGQGMDEQWAGYDYYRGASSRSSAPTVQGVTGSPVRPECLTPEFAALAERPAPCTAFPDRLRSLQYRDLTRTKLPRALRYNDRVSMRASVELREPFLDHRLVELAFRQSEERKIRGGTGKWLLRQAARALVPAGIALAPKRPLQTPQREWLRGELQVWMLELVDAALDRFDGSWLRERETRHALRGFAAGDGDNSYFVWQWINLALSPTVESPTHV